MMTEQTNNHAQRLMAQAMAVAGQAYAPYSGFSVGAALETESGLVYVGTNIENTSLGLTICAERSAVAAAVSAGERRFRGIAIFSAQADRPLLPCGACLQVLAEFADDLVIYSQGSDGDLRQTTLTSLLPQAFSR
jgi:cytidine deaminase